MLSKTIEVSVDSTITTVNLISYDEGRTWRKPQTAALVKLGAALAVSECDVARRPDDADPARRVGLRVIQYIGARGNYAPASGGSRTKRKLSGKRRTERVAAQEAYVIDRYRGGADAHAALAADVTCTDYKSAYVEVL